MASEKTKEVIGVLAQVTGGAVAGVIDVKFANKMPFGLPLGAAAGIALGLAGMFGDKLKLPRKACEFALDAGSGMLAFEAGTIAAQKTLKSMLPAPQTSGVMGAGAVGRLPNRAPMSSQNLMSQLHALESMYGHAA
jgi:hypothetical protein